MSTETNKSRARAYFERLAGEEPATDLVSGLIKMLDDAETRGREAATANLSGDRFALSLIQGTVREKLAAITGKNGLLAFPKVALHATAANIATAVAAALDNYEAPDAG